MTGDGQTGGGETAPSRADRDARGWFTKGNAVSKKGGNPHFKRLASMRSTIAATVTDADLADVLRGLLALAKKGDTQAARVLLDRVLGQARREPSPAIDLPDLSSAAGVAEALRRVASAAAAGELAPDEAGAAVTALRGVLDSDILVRLEERLRAIEGNRRP